MVTQESFPGGSAVKNLPAVQETEVQSLGWEDPLEEGMATHSSILSGRIQWTENPGGLSAIGLQRVRHDSGNLLHTHISIRYHFHSRCVGVYVCVQSLSQDRVSVER